MGPGTHAKRRSPFGKLTDEQRAVLAKALGKLTATGDRELRDQLLTHLQPADAA